MENPEKSNSKSGSKKGSQAEEPPQQPPEAPEDPPVEQEVHEEHHAIQDLPPDQYQYEEGTDEEEEVEEPHERIQVYLDYLRAPVDENAAEREVKSFIDALTINPGRPILAHQEGKKHAGDAQDEEEESYYRHPREIYPDVIVEKVKN